MSPPVRGPPLLGEEDEKATSSLETSSTSDTSTLSAEGTTTHITTEKQHAPSPPEKKTIESFVNLSWYCGRVLLFSQFLIIASAGNMLFMVYAGANPKRVGCTTWNGTYIENVCKEADWTNADCAEFDPQYEFKSLNVEFGYFCSSGHIVKTSVSVQMFGVLIGALFFGQLSDRHGRKLTLMITYIAITVVGSLSTFTNDFFVFTAMRTIGGFFTGGQICVYIVYKLEQSPRKHRFLISSFFNFSPNMILLAGVAYLSHDWRRFQWALTLLSTPAAIMFFFVFESPRWLIQKGRLDEAKVVLEKIQRIDGREDNLDGIQTLLEEEFRKQAEAEKKRYGMKHLFHTPSMAIAITVLSLGIMITSMTSYGLMFNVEALSGSLYINSALLGLMRWVLNMAMGFAELSFVRAGRKVFHTIAQGSVAVGLCLICVFHMVGVEPASSTFVRVCTLLSATFCTQVFISKTVTTTEYFPTMIRNSAMSLKSTFSRIGTVLAPQLFLLSPSWIPHGILFVLALVDSVLFLVCLPETKGRAMPEVMPERKEKSRLPRVSSQQPRPLLQA